MKKILSLVLLFGYLIVSVSAQIKPVAKTGTSKDGKYTYQYWEGDPMGVRIYTLKNGFKVFTSVNKSEPSIMTFIPVRAGSKNDPSDATGLAHYLEHMLFKGTDTYGSSNYTEESKQLAVIESLYEKYNKSKDEAVRKQIYHQIDSVSLLASSFAIANEYDKMVSSIGAKNTNAFTSVEQTVYMNKIPANQLERWLTIEAERFRKPVMRLFHTELEAVYEEKNISLDNDQNKVYETLFAELFKNHTYGTQTTIGTVEHLKNPSLVRIREYLEKYYVPNNMAMCLAGDLNPDSTVALVDKYMGGWASKPVPAFTFKPEESRNAPTEVTVKGPDAGSVTIGFRLPGVGHADYAVLSMIDMILANSSAGLIDLNLVKKQKVLEAYSAIEGMQDYSVALLVAVPKENQSLQEAKNLLMEQLEKVKKGEFGADLLPAIVNNQQITDIRKYESSESRAYSMIEAYTTGQNWGEFMSLNDKMAALTKEQVIAAANKYYGNDYVVVYKEIGKDENTVKVEKPEITPVEVNRDIKSPFHEKVLGMKSGNIQPLFIDYNKDIQIVKAGKIPVHYLKNTENQLFSIYYILDMGKNQDPKLALAVKYLEFLGTDKMSAEEISKKFYALGCDFGVEAGDDEVYVYLTGVDKSFKEGLALFEELLANAKADDDAYREMVSGILKQRADAKLDKRTIMFRGLLNYGLYGERNPFTNIIPESDLAGINPVELCDLIKQLNNYEHRILYYGPKESAALVTDITQLHKTPVALMPVPQSDGFVMKPTTENQVLFVHYDMVQAELIWLNRSDDLFDSEKAAVISLYNEYFGGGMGSVVFQTIRESKALAYSTFSAYRSPEKLKDHYYSLAYVGTQADKLPQAKAAMMELLEDMPTSDVLFESAKEALKNKIASERIIRTGILMNYESARKKGLDHDIRRDIFQKIPNLKMDDIKRFHDQEIKGKSRTLLVMGSRDKVDMIELKKYGTVREVTLEEVFGY
jgi:predicted Zn-dependent peptidase